MIEQLIEDWLAEYSALTPDEINTFANTINNRKDIISAIYAVFEDRQKYNSVIDSVCTVLFKFYRSSEIELKRFTLIFLPTLIYVYLNAVAHGEKKSCRGIEALLVGIYNLEAVDENCQAQNISFRLPSLAQASIYHEPMSLAPASLTESALRRLEECNTKLVRWGPLPQLEKILAQNRLSVMTALLFIFNRHMIVLSKDTMDQLCRVASMLVTQGFTKPGSKRVSFGNSPVLPRIIVSQPFLLELLQSLYIAVYNSDAQLALQAVEEIHQRASYQCFPEVLLVTNSIKNSTKHAYALPMGISMAITPTTTSTTVSKSMITNASFRTKKLPDDIPIIQPNKEGDSSGLGSITEEKEPDDNKEGQTGNDTGVVMGSGGVRRSLPKMAVSFGKKTRERLQSRGMMRSGSKLANGGTVDSGMDSTDDTEEIQFINTSDSIEQQNRPAMQVSSV